LMLYVYLTFQKREDDHNKGINPLSIKGEVLFDNMEKKVKAII